MTDLDLTDGPANPELDELEELLVVPPRRGSSGALVPALALILVALGFLVARSRLADWRGFESRSLAASEAPKQVLTSVPAAAKPPVPAEPKPTPRPIAEVASKIPEVASQVDPMAEIAREAEQKRQEKEELERLKTAASQALADAPSPPPQPMNPAIQRREALLAMARHQVAVDQMLTEVRRRHDRMFNDMLARQRAFHRQIPQGFGFPGEMKPFGDMGRDQVPSPPVPQFPEDVPNDRLVRQERGSFILPGGGRGEWRSTLTIIQGADGGFRH
jgi:hypothetical protein